MSAPTVHQNEHNLVFDPGFEFDAIWFVLARQSIEG